MKTKTTPTLRKITSSLATLLAVAATPAAFAASQIWSNAPVSALWSTPANWIGNAVPGQATLNTSAQNGDTITFNSPLFGGIGGAANPFRTSDTNRQVRIILFDTANCGPYVLTTSNGYTFGLSATLNTVPGGVVVNPTVTNAQIIEHLTTRLQSSQNGVIGFTNDSTTVSATLSINRLTNTSASSRPLFLNLAGANPGENTISSIDDFAGGGGAIHVFKYGPGKWVFAGANDLPQKTSAGGGGAAHVEINAGTLVVQNVASLGALSAGNIFVTNTGVLQIDGITPQNLGMSLRNGGQIRMNGVGGINGLIVGNQAGTIAGLTTTAASDVFTVGAASVISGGAADAVLNISGPGTMVFATANTFVGRWSFNSGTNQLNNASALGTAANLHIAAGAILDTAALGTYSLTTAALSANGTGTTVGGNAATLSAGLGGTFDFGTKAINLTFTPTGFAGDTTHPALFVSSGTISLSGNAFTVNNASGTPLGAGTYRLIEQATGTVAVAGGSYAVVTGAGLAAGQIGEIQIVAGNVNLVVSPHVPVALTWQGGNPNNVWDRLTTANWFNGVSSSVFVTSDDVTFDGAGAAFPTVDLAETLIPSNVKIDTTANNYTLLGVGQIAGPTKLTKLGTGVLLLQAANSYNGGTIVSNGTLRVGIENAIPGSGNSVVSVVNPAVIDLNNFNNTVAALAGNGVVDNLGGAAAILSVGANNSSSTFTGVVQNTSGTTALRKIGSGTLTLPGANTYTGGTIIDGGTLRVDNYNSLAGGPVTNNAGTLNITTNILIGGLSGAGGTVANNSTALATTITLQGEGDYSGVIANGSGGGRVGLFIKSGTTKLNGNSTYTNGTVVASGATLGIGVINPGGSGVPGTAGIIASNGAAISLPTSLSTSSQVPNSITNIEANGTVYFSSIGQANSFNGQFFGGANATNVFAGPMSIGGALSFSNFLGTVVISNGASVRMFNATAGGDNTVFDVRGGIFSRDISTIRLGALLGNGGIYNPSVSAPATYLIGAKGLNTTYSGLVVGSNSIVKVGAGSLTFDGVSFYTNAVTLPDASTVDFPLFTNAVAYLTGTTVSNGTLRIVAPNNLTNCASITLAGASAVLDASQLGYATNQTTLDINSVPQPTNTVVVTNATIEVLASQSLNGFGGIIGHVNAAVGSTINVGLPVGTLTITGNLRIDGTVNVNLNRTNLAQNSGRLIAGSFSGGGATLNITNLGPTLLSGTTFQLFSAPVTAFAAVNLPATDATGQITYVWQNNVAVNGTITLVSGLNPTPGTLTNAVVGNSLNLSWATDHIGWALQAQTNSLNVGISTNWATLPASLTTNQISVPIVSTNPTVFYRLNLPLP